MHDTGKTSRDDGQAPPGYLTIEEIAAKSSTSSGAVRGAIRQLRVVKHVYMDGRERVAPEDVDRIERHLIDHRKSK